MYKGFMSLRAIIFKKTKRLFQSNIARFLNINFIRATEIAKNHLKKQKK